MIVDLLDAVFLKLSSIEIILKLLKETSRNLEKSAFVIPFNPPLKEEIKYVLEKAKSSKRKIVQTLDEAKEWTGISQIIIKKD
ncbi:MAG: hypothetical protein BAJALOKI3v1_380002 [Promethearchaeota archaeon]|nr:MAG: hypothetical protein BAJALOKI3v1_380002 [Candidatus Lokiarchaeota archaeon]